jgi:hypothetical protein
MNVWKRGFERRDGGAGDQRAVEEVHELQLILRHQICFSFLSSRVRRPDYLLLVPYSSAYTVRIHTYEYKVCTYSLIFHDFISTLESAALDNALQTCGGTTVALPAQDEVLTACRGTNHRKNSSELTLFPRSKSAAWKIISCTHFAIVAIVCALVGLVRTSLDVASSTTVPVSKAIIASDVIPSMLTRAVRVLRKCSSISA